MALIRALKWELGSNDPLDGLELFEKWVTDYEVERERLVGEETKVADDIKIEPSCIRLAMPETEKEAQRCVEMLESHQQQKWEDIDGMQRAVTNSL